MKQRRVILNEEGVRHTGVKERTGVIVGESRDKTCWRVLWDGNIYPQVFHKSFLSYSRKKLGDWTDDYTALNKKAAMKYLNEWADINKHAPDSQQYEFRRGYEKAVGDIMKHLFPKKGGRG
jgi:hypothetical protein